MASITQQRLRATAWVDEPEWTDPLDNLMSSTDDMLARFDANREEEMA